MAVAIPVNQIVREIEMLDYSDKLNILTFVVNMLKTTEKSAATHSLFELKGLGKELWQRTNVDSYISMERESWN